jgi:diguanylate cyclase (GGDEF)-like protein
LRPSHLAKVLARGLRVSWRDEPTQYDIEAVDANIRRVGLVIRLRWVLVVVLALFSLAAAGIYTMAIPARELVRNLTIPGFALVFVLAYNAFYQATYQRLGNIAILNHAQLMFDILVVGVLIHYSGGVYSWFHAMFLLFILEGAFILPRGRDVWLLTGFAGLVYAVILTGQYMGWLPHVPVPFVENDLQTNGFYMAVRALWVFTILSGTASISSFLMSEVRGREKRLAESTVVDEATGLYNRAHFSRALKAEVRRARRTDGVLGVILMDVDDFTRFNETFGYAAGNDMLRVLADELKAVVTEGTDADPDLLTLCRYGGEEFALIVPGEPENGPESAFATRLFRLAENLRAAIQRCRVDDAGVTASVGMAVYPSDAGSLDELLSVLDEGVATSVAAGGNTVTAVGAHSGDAPTASA